MATVKSETKYERLRKIGIGSYGVVFKCINRQSGQIVAIKRYSENDSDPIIRKIAMREVRMLRQLKHPNLINLIEVFRRKRRLHLVFDYCELTVLDVIEKYANNCPLTLIKKIIWQTVNAINYCHTHNCIHRDIKPENILINQSGIVKLCDFGFARTINNPSNVLSSTNHQQQSSTLLAMTPVKAASRRAQHDGSNSSANNEVGDANNKENKSDSTDVGCSESSTKQQLVESVESVNRQQISDSPEAHLAERQALTEYVATRWYRAPELLIGEIYYDIKIDIWAIGCVTAELMRGSPIWPGKTDFDQLCIIKSSLGPLTDSQTHTLVTQCIYDQVNIERLLPNGGVGGVAASESLERKLPSRVGPNGIEFVVACLKMDPNFRPTSEQLLNHPYIYSARMTQFMDSSQLQVAASGDFRHNGNQNLTLSSSTSAANSRAFVTNSSSREGAAFRVQKKQSTLVKPPTISSSSAMQGNSSSFVRRRSSVADATKASRVGLIPQNLISPPSSNNISEPLANARRHRMSTVSTSSGSSTTAAASVHINPSTNHRQQHYQLRQQPFIINTNINGGATSKILSQANNRLNSQALIMAAAGAGIIKSSSSSSSINQSIKANHQPIIKRRLVPTNSTTTNTGSGTNRTAASISTADRLIKSPTPAETTTGSTSNSTTQQHQFTSSIPRSVLYKQTELHNYKPPSPSQSNMMMMSGRTPANKRNLSQQNHQELQHKRKQSSSYQLNEPLTTQVLIN